jgi:ABC-type multidrug transport system permease subunit
MISLGSTTEQFFTMYLIIFSMSFTATSTGMFAGSIVRDPKVISSIITIIALPFLIFSGFFKNYSSMPGWIGWIRFISPFNYSYTSLTYNETLYKPSLIDEVHFDVSLWIAILIQFCLGIGFRILAFFFLMLKKDKLQ